MAPLSLLVGEFPAAEKITPLGAAHIHVMHLRTRGFWHSVTRHCASPRLMASRMTFCDVKIGVDPSKAKAVCQTKAAWLWD